MTCSTSCSRSIRRPTPNPIDFLGAQFDAGLAWIHFPEGHGGPWACHRSCSGWSTNAIYGAGGPNAMYRNPIGHGMCGPTVVAWGSDEQKARYLRPLFTGEEVWCQLFSEPGSGSDFAGLSSSGIQDGEEWICNGQKVWTTLAHLSKWGLLIVRSDPQAVKHAGLTAFVVDMQDPTVEIRPLRQMTGEAEFNEVFFSDTRIHESEMLGKPGDGWRVSLTTLMNERVSIGGTIPQKGSGMIAELVKAWQNADDEPQGPGPSRRRDVAVVAGRGGAPHQHPSQSEPQDGRSRARRARSARWRRPTSTRRSTSSSWT